MSVEYIFSVSKWSWCEGDWRHSSSQPRASLLSHSV